MSTRWRLLITLIAIGLATFFVIDRPVNLGLDLEGGTQIVLDLEPRPGQELTGDVANRTLEILRRRVDSLGVSEPNLEVAGNKRIIVELPGVTDPERAVNVIGTTAQLSFHPVLANLGTAQTTTTTSPQNAQPATSETTIAPGVPGVPPGSTDTTAVQNTPTTAASLGKNTTSDVVLGQTSSTETTSTTTTTPTTTTPTDADGNIVLQDDLGQLIQLGPSSFTGEGVATATAMPPDTSSTTWYIEIEFKGDGQKKWTEITGQAACNQDGDPKRQVAIVLDNEVISHPQVQTDIQCGVGITGDRTIITGNFTGNEAKNLALLIRGGALPVDVKVASQQVIGPELGDAAIDASITAVILGGILTIIYVFLYYRGLGLVAGVALAAYSLLSFAVLKSINVTLTLPGIAGFVLAIAMAMDSNVLVYERVKEEFAHGRSMRLASQLGFKNALSAIIDSNATTFIAAGTLFFLAVGEVRGFGVTLLIGTAVSIFVTLIVLRTMVTGILSLESARKRPRFLGMYVGAKFRQRMSENPPYIMGAARYMIVISMLVMVIALAGVGFKGINYGIEFSGGRLLEYTTSSPVDVDQAREDIDKLGFPHAVVQRSGSDDTSIRVEELSKDQALQVDEMMKRLGGGTAERLRDETIGPSFSNELKNKAKIGLIIGVGLQLLWVAYRFRWTFGIGAVVAMIHDALLVLGLFAWLGKPFDAVFLAALLAIIAFSVNDSVVVFDRIREQRRRRATESFAKVVSDACAQTFPRTINISLSAMFILGALFVLGGQTLRDFALALLIGVVTGVFSSVMIASPIAVWLERWKPALSTGVKTVSTAKSETPKVKNPGTNRPPPRPRKKTKKH